MLILSVINCKAIIMKGVIEKYDLEKQFGFVRSIDNGELFFFPER